MAREGKTPRLPEAGQWPDKVAPAALVAGIVLTTVGFLMAFLTVPPVGGATCPWPSRRSWR